jgi:hypothetical protein
MEETSGQNMVIQLQSLLSKLGLMHYVITFWKTKGINLTTMASTLCTIIDYEQVINLWNLWRCMFWCMWCLMMFKACQYATNDEKDYKDLTHG